MTQDLAALVARLRAPAYWMSGSGEGHEGENDVPREAADAQAALGAVYAERDRALAAVKEYAAVAEADRKREREEGRAMGLREALDIANRGRSVADIGLPILAKIKEAGHG